MDGLLVDSEPFWRRVETDVFDALGVDIRPLIAGGATMGMRVDEVVGYFRELLDWGEPGDPELVRRIADGVVAAVWSEGALMPGALDALDYMAERGLTLALASGSTHPVIEAVLDRFDLRPRFAAVCSADDDTLGKPHPALFLRTAATIGAGALECVVLEDAVNGCIAAKAARMRVVAVPDPEHFADARFAIADAKLASLLELEDGRVERLLGLRLRPEASREAS